MYKYVVAVKDFDKEIYLEMVEFDTHQEWKEIYLNVVGIDYFGEDIRHKEWIMEMPKHFQDAKKHLKNGCIDVEILTIVS